jgi:SMI1/KNR4 family protein SUKH-1
MKPDAFLKKIADDNAVRPGTHELAAPLRGAESGRWKARHAGLKLPNDLLGFLKRANGIRFHLSPASPIGATARLLPLREIQTATALLYQDQEEEDEALPGSWLGLTDDAEGDQFLVLDVRKRLYLDVDPADPEDAQAVGRRFEEALDWLFARYLDR